MAERIDFPGRRMYLFEKQAKFFRNGGTCYRLKEFRLYTHDMEVAFQCGEAKFIKDSDFVFIIYVEHWCSVYEV